MDADVENCSDFRMVAERAGLRGPNHRDRGIELTNTQWRAMENRVGGLPRQELVCLFDGQRAGAERDVVVGAGQTADFDAVAAGVDGADRGAGEGQRAVEDGVILVGDEAAKAGGEGFKGFAIVYLALVVGSDGEDCRGDGDRRRRGGRDVEGVAVELGQRGVSARVNRCGGQQRTVDAGADKVGEHRRGERGAVKADHRALGHERAAVVGAAGPVDRHRRRGQDGDEHVHRVEQRRHPVVVHPDQHAVRPRVAVARRPRELAGRRVDQPGHARIERHVIAEELRREGQRVARVWIVGNCREGNSVSPDDCLVGDRVQLGREVEVYRHHRRVERDATVLVSQRTGDREILGRCIRVVVQVTMLGHECAFILVDHGLRRAAVAPVHHQRGCVEDAGVGEAAGQREQIGLNDDWLVNVERSNVRQHIFDGNRRHAGSRIAVVVGNRRGDGVDVARYGARIVVEVGVSGREGAHLLVDRRAGHRPVSPVDGDGVNVLDSRVEKAAHDRHGRSLEGGRRGDGKGLNRRSLIRDGDGHLGLADTAVVIHEPDADHVLVRRAVVGIQVRDREFRRSRAQCDGLLGPVAPGHLQRERVARAGVGDGARQAADAPLGDGGCRQARQLGCDVAHDDSFRGETRAQIVVGHLHADRVGVLRRVGVVEVLVSHCEWLRAARTGRQCDGFDVARRQRIAPVDRQRERVERPRIGDDAGHDCGSVLVDRSDGIERHRRFDIRHEDGFRGEISAQVLVHHLHANRVGVLRCSGVVEVLASHCERLRAAGAGRQRDGFDVAGRQRIAPVDRQRERVERPRIGDGAGQCHLAVFTGGGHGIERQ